MGLIWTLVIGFIVGAIAKVILPSEDDGGVITTILLGISGSFVGGLLLGILPGRTGSLLGFIGAIFGAVILLWLYRRFLSDRPA